MVCMLPPSICLALHCFCCLVSCLVSGVVSSYTLIFPKSFFISYVSECLLGPGGTLKGSYRDDHGVEGSCRHHGGTVVSLWQGKEMEVDEEGPSVLRSPLVLDHSEEGGNTSDDSYHTPPLAGSSIPSHPSSSLVKSDKDNVPVYGIGYDPKITLVPIGEAPLENVIPIPIGELSLNISGLDRLIAVCGQQAVHTAGCPKSTFHPYDHSCHCPIGTWSSTH